jgi:hypothetical protein
MPPSILALSVVLLLLATAGAGAQDAPRPVPGTAPAAGSAANAAAEQDLETFRRIRVSGRGEVVLAQGGPEHLRVDPLPEGVRVHAKVREGRLLVDVEDHTPWWRSIGSNRPAVRMVITFPALDGLTLSGAVTARASALDATDLRISASGGTQLRIDGLRARTLRVKGSGAVDMRLAGVATEQHVELSGAALYDASRLASDAADVEVAGAAKVSLDVARTLHALVSGAGRVEYLGDPQVRSRVSGAGHVGRREARDD